MIQLLPNEKSKFPSEQRWMKWINRSSLVILATLFVLMGSTTSVSAQDEAEEDKLPSISEKTEDMTKIPGYITLYRDEKKDLLWAEIPSGVMKDEFLIATSISAGPLAGLQTNDVLLKFERQGDSILLVEPNIFYTATGELEEIVEVSYPDLVLGKFPIVAEQNGGVLVDLKNLLEDQSARFVGRRPPSTFTQVTRANSFPENTIVELTFRNQTSPTGIYFNIGALPKTGYKPRVADQRIGYFLTAKNDFSKGPREDSTFDRFVNRWHLEKQDPSLDLSPPKEPIVFYIEDSVPIKYRRWVREGFEVWNEAFEEIGFVDAIEVRQQTENNEFANYDPQDSRYNFFRWITSQRAFAIAPSRVDPRSGQILDSDILFDESMVRAYVEDYDLLIEPLISLDDMPSELRQWVAKDPSVHPNWPQLSLHYETIIANDERYADKTPREMFKRDLMLNGGLDKHRFCSIGQHLTREMALHSIGLLYSESALVGANAQDNGDDNGDEGDEEKESKKSKSHDEWPEEFIGPIIREIVAHEMGHALGLRHNFKASSWKTIEEIRNTPEGEPTAGSVMDYLPFMLNPDGSEPNMYITPTVGPYDRWAISYGYAIPGSSGFPSNEKKTLDQILAKNGEPGLQYGTDEDVGSPDPLIARWDLGQDSVTFYKERAEIGKKIMEDILEKTIQEGENFSKARRYYSLLLAERFRGVTYATKYLGGYDINRRTKLEDGESPAPIEVVDADRQREALNFIIEELFKPDSVELDPDTLKYLSAERWSHRGTTSYANPLTYPIQDRILAYQNSVLFRLTNPSTVQYLYDAEFYVDEDTDLVTIPELFESLREGVWEEVINPSSRGNSNRKPMIPTLRRNLQRSHLEELIGIANSDSSSLYPTVARTLAYHELKVIGDTIKEAINDVGESRLDTYSLAHLQESKARIDAALEATLQYGGNNSAGGFSILILGQEDEDALDSAPITDFFDY